VEKIRLVYVYLGGDLSETLPGVQNKIISKINYLNTHRSTCFGLTVSGSSEKKTKFQRIQIIKNESFKNYKFFNTIISNKRVFDLLLDHLLSISDQFDFIIFRYPLASNALLNFCKTFQNRVIIEHNTLEIPELVLNCRKHIWGTKFSLKPGYFINMLENGLLPIFREFYYRKNIAKSSYLKLYVSYEIQNYYDRINSKTRNLVISNSIDTSLFKSRDSLSAADHDLKMYMLVGFEAEWHGIERIINSLKTYTGVKKLVFYFIGVDNSRCLNINPESSNVEINFVKRLTKNDLDAFLSNFNIGLGTLAAYTKKMHEASPLKVREYIARGFPIVIGYIDTDLSLDKEINDFVYQVKNDSSMIDFNAVVNWYSNLERNVGFQHRIQEFAKLKLDTSVKMNILIEELFQSKNDFTHS
jgi:hypothetical protein